MQMDQQWKKSFQTISTYYGSMALFLTISHNVFLLYYVDMFVSVYKIDKVSFWIGEILFLLWNSINDPLFGWMSDRKLLQNSAKSTDLNHVHSMDIILNRLKNLSKSGPLFALSFSLFWIRWLPPALQFTICLCLYDGFLTSVDLQHTALLADLAVYASDRAKLNRKSSIFSTFGSISVFLSYVFWDKQSVLKFQVFCTTVALFSMLGFVISTRLLTNLCVSMKKYQQGDELESVHFQDGETSDTSFPLSKTVGLKKYVGQLASNRNFRWFVSMNLVQVFHCHFNSNFFPLFLDALVGDAIAPGIGPMLIGISFVLPHVNNLYFLSLCDKYGVYKVIKWLFYTKLTLALVMLATGHGSVWMICLFIASNRIFTEGTCKLLNLVVSDLVDDDYVQHNREHAASAVLFGMSSLLSKPGQTLAPLFGTWLLAVYTGEDVFQRNLDQESSEPIHRDLVKWPDQRNVEWMSRRDACFFLLVTVPIVCAVLQLVSWSRFTLHGARLNQVKSLRLSRTTDFV